MSSVNKILLWIRICNFISYTVMYGFVEFESWKKWLVLPLLTCRFLTFASITNKKIAQCRKLHNVGLIWLLSVEKRERSFCAYVFCGLSNYFVERKKQYRCHICMVFHQCEPLCELSTLRLWQIVMDKSRIWMLSLWCDGAFCGLLTQTFAQNQRDISHTCMACLLCAFFCAVSKIHWL